MNSKKKIKQYKCSSFGNMVDDQNYFYRQCFDRLLTDYDLVFFNNQLGNKIFKCKFCRGKVKEIENE